jgi:hypothetical protein
MFQSRWRERKVIHLEFWWKVWCYDKFIIIYFILFLYTRLLLQWIFFYFINVILLSKFLLALVTLFFFLMKNVCTINILFVNVDVAFIWLMYKLTITISIYMHILIYHHNNFVLNILFVNVDVAFIWLMYMLTITISISMHEPYLPSQ